MKLKNILASVTTVDGEVLWFVYDPKTNKPSYYPIPQVPRGLKTTRRGSQILGIIREEDFNEFWRNDYKSKYGKLEPRDVTQDNHYKSKPDRYNATLNLFIEIKDHKLSQRLLRSFFDGIVWLNKKSMDYKSKHQKANPNASYVASVFFVDEGWFSVPIKEVVRCSHKRSTYGDPVYEVPLEAFEAFDDMIKKRAKELGLN